MFDSAVRGNTISVEYGFVISVANQNYIYIFIFIKIKAVFIKLSLFTFANYAFLLMWQNVIIGTQARGLFLKTSSLCFPLRVK